MIFFSQIYDASLFLLLLLLEIPVRHVSCPPMSNFLPKALNDAVSVRFKDDCIGIGSFGTSKGERRFVRR